MISNKEKKLRLEIFKKIAQIDRLRKKKVCFVPGKTAVNYAGRIYDQKEMISLVDAALDFWLTAGPKAALFERRLADFLKIKYCSLVNSGSSANLLAVSALTSPQLKQRRLKPGDEVITTACGFPTTLNPILQNGLVPVFVDVELGSYNIDPDKIEKAISKKTKAIFIAHTLGNPADLERISKIARKYKLWFIEDNCDALGSKYQGRFTGTFGDISTCSFYPAHHITMGEGGAVLTDNPLLYKIIISLRDWGRDCFCQPGQDNSCQKRFSQKHAKLPWGYDHKYVYSHIGYNLKATDLQAAIGLAQLGKLSKFIEARRKNFGILYKHLAKYKKYLILPKAAKVSAPSWFGFPVLVRPEAPFNRSDIIIYLEKHKIATRMLFGGNLTKQPAYQGIKSRVEEKLENTDLVMNDLFWIGVYPGITPKQLAYIKRMFDDFFRLVRSKDKGVLNKD
ncbi:MAG: lipopolysaccharide biosynthesis protein RfbH [Candidatus Omnitrophica bacterium]|nr:lipopolysaccharide biosynthesis protein RfbH [Candidatus Omnitrophota bacterium]